MGVKRYIPSIGVPNWNIKDMSRDDRNVLKSKLVIRQVSTHEDYQRVITYMYTKFPFEMDGVKIPDDQLLPGQQRGQTDTAIQWNYRAGRNAVAVMNERTGNRQSMYAFVVYDSERDMEPVAFAGSYFVIGDIVTNDETNKRYLVNSDGDLDENGPYQLAGQGIVMFVDPSYRRLGLGTDLWLAEAELYVESLRIRYQHDIQNQFSLQSTRNMFDNPEKCVVTYEGRLKNDGTRAGIRVLLDYTDPSLKRGFGSIPDGLRTIYESADWRWTEREHFTEDRGRMIWKAGKLV